MKHEPPAAEIHIREIPVAFLRPGEVYHFAFTIEDHFDQPAALVPDIGGIVGVDPCLRGQVYLLVPVHAFRDRVEIGHDLAARLGIVTNRYVASAAIRMRDGREPHDIVFGLAQPGVIVVIPGGFPVRPLDPLHDPAAVDLFFLIVVVPNDPPVGIRDRILDPEAVAGVSEVLVGRVRRVLEDDHRGVVVAIRDACQPPVAGL